MYMLKYETSSKYLGFKRIHYKEFDNINEVIQFIDKNNIVIVAIYKRGIK